MKKSLGRRVSKGDQPWPLRLLILGAFGLLDVLNNSYVNGFWGC